MIPLLLAAALAQTPADEPMRFGERAFGLSSELTWTVYQGRHYLTASQFAERVGDDGMIQLLSDEKRRQSRSALIGLVGGTAAVYLGPYLAILGFLAEPNDPVLGGVMMASGVGLTLGGAVAYYTTAAVLLVKAPRRNRVDLYYARDEAEAWLGGYNQRLTVDPGSTGRIELTPFVTPRSVGVAVRF